MTLPYLSKGKILDLPVGAYMKAIAVNGMSKKFLAIPRLLFDFFDTWVIGSHEKEIVVNCQTMRNFI
jgi:hypothetical protein